MTTNLDAPETPASAPPPPARLERSRDDNYIAGVCGGLGRYFNVDPVIFRVVLACMALFGAGLLLYALAWAFIPESGSDSSIAQAAKRGRGQGKELVIIIVAVIIGFAAIDGVFHDADFVSGWFTPLLIIGAVWWWHRSGRDHTRITHHLTGPTGHAPAAPPWPTPPPPMPPAAPPQPSAFWAASATTAPTMPMQSPYHWPQQPDVPRVAREKSRLWSLTLSAMLLALGVAALLDATEAISLSLQSYLAIALIAVGAGLVVGAFIGRSRGLIMLGVLLTAVLSVVSVVDVPLRGGAGDVAWVVNGLDQLDDEYHLGAGSAVLDLRAVEFGDGPRTVEVTNGFGDLEVRVPDGVSTRVVGNINAGAANVFGARCDGFDFDIDTGKVGSLCQPGRDALGATQQGTPELTVDFRIGIGELRITR